MKNIKADIVDNKNTIIVTQGKTDQYLEANKLMKFFSK